MPPNSDVKENPEFPGSMGFRTLIPGFGVKEKTARAWLKGRREVDGAENYWRVHDDLYDFGNFVKIHPGGSEWLELTKGTDITEAFEAHHLHTGPENMLKTFHVKKAESPRISPYTFKENGFYKTLKRRVWEQLKETPKKPITTSALYTDSFFLLTVILSVFACNYWSYSIGCLAGFCLGSVVIAAHNYFHQKDNFRMYYFQMAFLSTKDWRVSHALSHHLFPNSVIDMEMYMFEPLVGYFPNEKSYFKRYLTWIYIPPLWGLLFHSNLLVRTIELIRGDRNVFRISDLIAILLPTTMYLFNQNFIDAFLMWNFIVICGSYYFIIIGINAAHHDPKIFHDGDTPRSEKDFGIAQLDAVMDRKEIMGSHVWTLTTFGHHALHHLFPTIDHGLLNGLYPVLKKTMKEFDVDLRLSNTVALIRGQFQQIARNTVNPNPPDLHSWKNK